MSHSFFFLGRDQHATVPSGITFRQRLNDSIATRKQGNGRMLCENATTPLNWPTAPTSNGSLPKRLSLFTRQTQHSPGWMALGQSSLSPRGTHYELDRRSPRTIQHIVQLLQPPVRHVEEPLSPTERYLPDRVGMPRYAPRCYSSIGPHAVGECTLLQITTCRRPLQRPKFTPD